MSIPSYDQFIDPILRILQANPEGMVAKAVHDAAANKLGVTAEEKLELLPSGVYAVYKSRAGWAHDRLKRAGLSASPRRGHWQLTEAGFEFLRNHPQQLSPQEVEHLAVGFVERKAKAVGDGEDSATADIGPESATPEERLESAVGELRRSVSVELLETLGKVSPSYFETIVLELLHKMGYGASRSDMQRVGGSGDGGIDGVISLDKLGLEKVYVQAKRWQGSVGRPEVQAFYGALAGRRASKGVFITTSHFTAQAAEFANSVEKIVLVDGDRMAELMIDHEVGITRRAVWIPRIDGDFFEEN